MRNFVLTAVSMIALTGCEVGIGTYPSTQSHYHGSPQIVNTFTYCAYDYGYADYVWDFDASVTHSYDSSRVAGVWVDVYEGPYLVHSENLWLEQSDPYGNMSYWSGWTAEHRTSLYCDSHIHYTIETVAFDFDGNYAFAVDYLY
jgi:hypothetical protein